MGFLGKLFGKKETSADTIIYSPLAGVVIPLSEAADPAFASGAMGPGVGIEPSDGRLYAPADGEIAALFPTGHALGLRMEDGTELLIHIGIDTVELGGKGFTVHTEAGRQVKKGELLVEFDVEAIRAAGYQTTTMVLISSMQEAGQVNVLASGETVVGAPLLALK